MAVVVVTHDTRDEVLGCLASLATADGTTAGAAAGGDVAVVVADAGSRDGTADAVRAAHPHVTVLELANAGFGRSANAAIRATDAAVVVVANADVRFAPDAPARLAAAVRSAPDLALVGPRLTYPDGRPQASARVLPDLPTALAHAVFGRWWPGNRWTRRYRRDGAAVDVAGDVDWVSGATFAVRRDAFDAVGGFDPGYPLYVEDVDLAARLRDAGWRVRFDPVTTVVHRVGASTSRRRLRSLWWHARGLDRFATRRYLPAAVRPVARPLLRLGLGAWVVATALAERTVGRGRSTTGE